METTIAYLSRGRLFLQTGTGAPREISSPYVESVRRSVVEIEQRRAWKTKGMGARFMRGFDFGGGSPNGNEIAFSITDITPGPAPGTLIYSLFVDDVSGLYLWDGKDERRLIHSNKFVIRDIDARGDKVLCTLEYGATANLALFDIETLSLDEITEGDSYDSHPSWIDEDSFNYQSAGIARDAAGHPVGRGPAHIIRLNVADGSQADVTDSAEHDFLSPQTAPDGSVWCIRRPYVFTGFPRPTPLTILKAILLAPWMVLKSIWAFLHIFSKMTTGEDLTPIGPRRKGPNEAQLTILGNYVDAESQEKASRKKGDSIPGIVPSAWKLVRQAASGWEPVKSGAVAFDFSESGELVWTNGRGLFKGESSSRSENLIEKLVVLRRQNNTPDFPK